MVREPTEKAKRLRGTLRQRVVSSFVILVGLSLFGVGTYVYFQTENRLLQQLDSSLDAAASQALLTLQEEDGRLLLRGEDSTVVPGEMEPTFSLRLLLPDGTQSDAAGQQVLGLPDHPAPGYLTVDVMGENWRVFTEPVPSASGPNLGWIQVARPLSPTENLLRALRTQLYLVLPIALVLAAAAAYLLTGRTLRPLVTISQVADSIRPGDLGRRIHYRGPKDEIGRLAAAFDRMLDRVEQAFLRERRFTSDASHELRTPLTAIKSGIGVTLSKTRTADEYQSALQDLEDQVDRLTRLSTNLLVLARAGRTRTDEPDVVELSELLNLTMQQLQPLAEEKGIRFDTEIPPGIYVSGFTEDLVRVFSNLLANSIRFTPSGGSVAVRARGCSRSNKDVVCVDVADTGAGIAKDDLPHIFEPFYRGGGVATQEQGTGLGLAIARDILVAHGGSLEVHSQQGAGSTFTVLLPSYVERRPD